MRSYQTILCAALAFAAVISGSRGGGAAAGEARDPHTEVNPLYADLLKNGLAIQGGTRLPVPPPVITEEMDAKAQMAALKKLAGDDYPLDELLRESIVAPHIYKFRDFAPIEKEISPHAVDIWFIAYGSLDKLAATNLQSQFFASRKDTKMTTLTEADLKTRGVTLKKKTDDFEESYVYNEQVILDRVQVEGTHHIVFTRKPDSLLLAGRMEPRFAKDEKFGNRWRPVTLQDDGTFKVGASKPYEGAGMYIRLTRMKEPAGAIFVEFHQVFNEPYGWFDGANLLRSKLPIVLQGEVRAFRRELLKLK